MTFEHDLGVRRDRKAGQRPRVDLDRCTFDGAGEFARAFGIPLTRIGTIKSGKGVRFILDGRTVELRGFNHFG